jgi:hypothetical protein
MLVAHWYSLTCEAVERVPNGRYGQGGPTTDDDRLLLHQRGYPPVPLRALGYPWEAIIAADSGSPTDADFRSLVEPVRHPGVA